MLIKSLALLLLNYFSAKTTRELMFRAKYASAQDKIQVVASAFSGVDPLTPESAEQVISVLGNINAARLIVTNAEGTAVYDSSENQNAIGQRVLLPAVVEALRGVPFRREDARRVLDSQPMSELFGGITEEQVLDTMFGS